VIPQDQPVNNLARALELVLVTPEQAAVLLGRLAEMISDSAPEITESIHRAIDETLGRAE